MAKFKREYEDNRLKVELIFMGEEYSYFEIKDSCDRKCLEYQVLDKHPELKDTEVFEVIGEIIDNGFYADEPEDILQALAILNDYEAKNYKGSVSK